MPHDVVPIDQIQTRIIVLRGHRVLLDADLAAFYGVPNKALNQAVKRNVDRFPSDFRFQLTFEEVANLKSQIVTSSLGYGGRRKLPFAFTEHGALMVHPAAVPWPFVHAHGKIPGPVSGPTCR